MFIASSVVILCLLVILHGYVKNNHRTRCFTLKNQYKAKEIMAVKSSYERRKLQAGITTGIKKGCLVHLRDVKGLMGVEVAALPLLVLACSSVANFDTQGESLPSSKRMVLSSD